MCVLTHRVRQVSETGILVPLGLDVQQASADKLEDTKVYILISDQQARGGSLLNEQKQSNLWEWDQSVHRSLLIVIKQVTYIC